MEPTKVRLIEKNLVVSFDGYILAKKKQLVEFGYKDLKLHEVREQAIKVLSGSEELSIIGMFIKRDIEPIFE